MIKYSRIKKIHFVGIGGSGMSGIAEVLHNMGFVVSGSDTYAGDVTAKLSQLGIKVYIGHTRENVADSETLVYSSAIKEDNVEIKEALARKIPVIPRAEMLAELMRVKFSIAVAGTHGKTSTTSMIATVLNQAGKDPTYVVGGRLKVEESGAKLGKSDYLVAEADESDGSFLQLFPSLAIITNIEDDHLDNYQDSMENLRAAFAKFGRKVPFYGSVILNIDCPNARAILPVINKRVITYSLEGKADIQAENIEYSAFSAGFDLVVGQRRLGRVLLNVGGRHNVSNALAAIAASLEIGVDFATIKTGLERFSLPERRLQVLFADKNYTVIDDYAHHPTEIKAVLDTLKKGGFKRVLAVFQPHRYTRLAALMESFTTCFAAADLVILAEIYAAGQAKIDRVDSRTLYEKIKGSGFETVVYLESFDRIIDYLEKEMKTGDVVVFLTAGNLTRAAHQLAGKLEVRSP